MQGLDHYLLFVGYILVIGTISILVIDSYRWAETICFIISLSWLFAVYSLPLNYTIYWYTIVDNK